MFKVKRKKLTEREQACINCIYVLQDSDCDWACDYCCKKVNDISDEECPDNLYRGKMEFTVREKRCKGCDCLYKDCDGDWACHGKKVNDISDDECFI